MFGKHFLTLSDFSAEELLKMLACASALKSQLKKGKDHDLLRGKSLAMIFQKPSTRTRVSFEVGMFQLGGRPVNIRPSEIELGERESIADVAQVLARYVDAVMLRVKRHTDLVEFAKFSTAPVINGLSDLYHPCQALSDMLTIQEHLGRLQGVRLCYIGDGNNMCNSLIDAARLLGLQMVVSCPNGYEPMTDPSEGPYEIVRDPVQAVRGAHVIYTDVWTSMGQEAEAVMRLRAFEGYSITRSLLEKADKKAIFMHCLPAHRGEEVDDYVLDSPQSVVFDQAENRLHAQKAILALLLHKDPLTAVA